MDAHLLESEFRQFLDSQIPDQESARIHGHLDSCPECAAKCNEIINARHAAISGASVSTSETEAVSPANYPSVPSFDIICPLGKGGMGVVYKAKDNVLQRMVALKVIRPERAAEQGFLARFWREARAMAAIRHDNVVTIYRGIEGGPVPILVMEYLEGESLATRARREKQLPINEVVRIGSEVAAGLEAVHEHGSIHRDIKPDNLWLEQRSGRVKILDFGLARNDGDMQLTQTGQFVGTAGYASPEQVRGEEVDFRSDLFSLGCVLYRLCTGREAFFYTSSVTYAVALNNNRKQAPQEINSQVPIALSDLIMSLLEKKPSNRPTDAATVGRELRKIAADIAVRLVPDVASQTTPHTVPNAESCADGYPKDPFTNEFGVEFVLIESGSFTMGSDTGNARTRSLPTQNETHPQFVTIENSFYLGKYPVTQAQWRAVMGDSGRRPIRFKFKGDNQPVESVSWEDIHLFLDVLNKVAVGYTYRLPTEAEWEYSCRAGETTEYCFGNDKAKLGDYACYSENSEERTHPVGQGKKCNKWGLFDMHGHVWEWCQDTYQDNHAGRPLDGSAWVVESNVSQGVVRGGSWISPNTECRSACRRRAFRNHKQPYYGFRLVAVKAETTGE